MGRPRREDREIHVGDMAVGQSPTIDLDDLTPHRESEVIEPVQGFSSKKYIEDLAFNEQPVTIRLERSSEKNSAQVALCMVQGKGAEILLNGKWITAGFLPIGVIVTVKRKYVEVLARAKHNTVETEIKDRHSERPSNLMHRFTSVKYPFSVISDKSPNGADWLTRLIAEG